MANRAYRIARWLDRMLTGGFYLAFLLELLLLSLSAPSRGGIFLLCAALAFSFTWLLRRLLGMKRPYQNESILLQPRRGTNDSFPSLHAFSAFFIATSAFTISPLLSYFLLSAAALLCILRVCLSIHYPRDVVGGAFLGVAVSIVTLILI